MDHMLDAWLLPDGAWRWKDEDELAEAVALAVVTADEAAAIRAEGERVRADVEARRHPICTDWTRWRPDPNRPVPVLPRGWDQV